MIAIIICLFMSSPDQYCEQGEIFESYSECDAAIEQLYIPKGAVVSCENINACDDFGVLSLE